MRNLLTAGALALVVAMAGVAKADDAADAAALKRGRLLFLQCRACHEVKAGLPAKVGPNLAGMIGRKAGSAPDFAYSPAMKAATFSWDKAALDKWLEKPSALVPGTAMAFAGVPAEKDRAAIIAYLEVETKP
jgi:cytochrome c